MSPPRLVILKRMQLIQGKVRPVCFIQAKVSPAVQAVLEEHFLSEALFKRASYSLSWPAGAVQIPAPLAPAMSSFLKNDGCPELTVKTILGGQMYQGANAWEMLCFELVAKLSFDNFCALVNLAGELNQEITYRGPNFSADFAAFEADLNADMAGTAGAPRLLSPELAA